MSKGDASQYRAVPLQNSYTIVKSSFNPSLLYNLHVFKRGNEDVTERNDLSTCK